MRKYLDVKDYELEGNIYVLPNEFGGRRTGLISGYRGQLFWHINNEPGTDWLAEHYFENDLIEPGSSCKCKIKLGGTILKLGEINGMPSGRQYALRDGSIIVAVGVIIKSKFDYFNNM